MKNILKLKCARRMHPVFVGIAIVAIISSANPVLATCGNSYASRAGRPDAGGACQGQAVGSPCTFEMASDYIYCYSTSAWTECDQVQHNPPINVTVWVRSGTCVSVEGIIYCQPTSTEAYIGPTSVTLTTKTCTQYDEA